MLFAEQPAKDDKEPCSEEGETGPFVTIPSAAGMILVEVSMPTSDDLRPPDPWFTEKRGTVLLYRVNRRPLPDSTLGSRQPPSVMNHLVEVLDFGEPVTKGTSHQREWILGNRVISPDEKTLSGQIGWQREGRRSTDRYDPVTRTWGDYLEEEGESARAPFAFDATTRILAVLQHGSFSETTVPKVFEDLLRQGERDREWPSTEWSVEPILDERDFVTWLRDVDAVTRVSLVAKLPNPDALDEFGAVWREMEARKARLLKQEMEAANEEEGLVGLEEDERVRNHIAMGTNGFGYVTAKGNRGGRSVSYDQRSRVAKETTDLLPPSWSDVAQALIQIAQRRRRKGPNTQTPSGRG